MHSPALLPRPLPAFSQVISSPAGILATAAVAVALPSPTRSAEPELPGLDRGDPHGHARGLGVHDPGRPAAAHSPRGSRPMSVARLPAGDVAPRRAATQARKASSPTCTCPGSGRDAEPARASGEWQCPQYCAPAAGGWRPGPALPERRASAEHRAGPRRPAPPPRLLPPGCSQLARPPH